MAAVEAVHLWAGVVAAVVVLSAAEGAGVAVAADAAVGPSHILAANAAAAVDDAAAASAGDDVAAADEYDVDRFRMKWQTRLWLQPESSQLPRTEEVEEDDRHVAAADGGDPTARASLATDQRWTSPPAA